MALTRMGHSALVHETVVTGYGVPMTRQSNWTDSPSVTRSLSGGRLSFGATTCNHNAS